MINKCLTYLDNHKEKINKFLPIFLISYTFLLILPYVFGRVEVLNNFFTQGASKVIFRFITIIYGIGFLSLLGISNKIRIKGYLLIGAAVLLILLIISTSIAERDIYRADGSYAGRISVEEYLIDFFRFVSGLTLFILLFSFMPVVMKNAKVFNYPLLLIVVLSMVAIVFSFILEYDSLIKLIKGGDEHAIDIHSIFQNKNTYGLFLFLSSLAIGFLIFTNNENKYLYLFIPLFFVTFMSIVIGCRTAFISCLALLFYLLIRSFITLRFYSKKGFYISISVLGAFLIVFVLYMAIPLFHGAPLNGLYDIVIYSFARLGEALFGRVSIWQDVPSFMTGIKLFIGSNLTNSKYLLIIHNGHFKDFHSGYVYFYACFGIIGTIVYCLLFIYVFYLVYLAIKKKPLDGLLVLVLLLVSMLFALPETYILFLSPSLFTFVTTLITIVYLRFILLNNN